jgi:hypothetical protein
MSTQNLDLVSVYSYAFKLVAGVRLHIKHWWLTRSNGRRISTSIWHAGRSKAYHMKPIHDIARITFIF